MRKPALAFAALLLGLTVVATIVGCDLLDSDPTAVEVKGETGYDCTYDWECKSNACVYPGRCQ